MCLNVYGNNLLRLKAQNDIRCYKVMGIKKDGKLITPYIHFPMEKGKIYEDKENEKIEKDFCIFLKEKCRLDVRYGYQIYNGFFHTFEQEADAKRDCDEFNRKRLNKDVVYQVYPCIIPSGSEYIKGICFNEEFAFASKKLMILDD